MQRRGLRIAVIVVALWLNADASASRFVDYNATGVRLAVNGTTALVTYRMPAGTRHVLVWGAINARFPDSGRRQVHFQLDYSGGWRVQRRAVWKTFRNTCRPYAGPPLAWLVAACTARDGSHWALQRWRVQLPDLGFLPWLPRQKSTSLQLSHWSGPPATLEIHQDWVYSPRYREVFGRALYRGRPVYGLRSTVYGAPLDGYGRLVYLDTFNSPYGRGWRRENSFLPHKRTGVFCYGFFPRDPTTHGYEHPQGYPRGKLRPAGVGTQYRVTLGGPGVTPDILWAGPALGPYDALDPADVAYERAMNVVLDSYHDRLCRQH